jgi:hypothetical protein
VVICWVWFDGGNEDGPAVTETKRCCWFWIFCKEPVDPYELVVCGTEGICLVAEDEGGY